MRHILKKEGARLAHGEHTKELRVQLAAMIFQTLLLTALAKRLARETVCTHKRARWDE